MWVCNNIKVKLGIIYYKPFLSKLDLEKNNCIVVYKHFIVNIILNKRIIGWKTSFENVFWAKMRSGTIFPAGMYILIHLLQWHIYILSKSVKTISSRENPTWRRTGGKKEGKIVCHTVRSLEQTLVVKGSACQGLTNKWQEMTDFEETPQRDLMLIGARLWMWQPCYHLSFSTGGNSYGENALHPCHFEQTTPPNTR